MTDYAIRFLLILAVVVTVLPGSAPSSAGLGDAVPPMDSEQAAAGATPRQISRIHGHISSGGGPAIVGGLLVTASYGQSVSGQTAVSGWVLNAGFLTEASPCCSIRGDVEHSGAINVADLTYLVSSLFQGGPDAPCFEEADLDGSGMLNIADLTYLVAKLFQGGPEPPPCP